MAVRTQAALSRAGRRTAWSDLDSFSSGHVLRLTSTSMAPSFSSSPLTAAAVAASPTPASANSSNTSPGHTTFRSLRSLLPFGPSKNASNNSHPSSSSSPQGNPSRGTFSGFGSMRKSLTRERERQTSLTNLLPVISIDKPSSSAPQSQDDGAVRRAASFSTIDTSTTNASLLQNVVLDLPTGLGSSPSLNSTRSTDTAPILRSISPGPPLSADLSTIIEADSSYMSKTEPRSSKPSSPTIEKALPDIPPPRADRMNNDQDASLDLNTTHLAEQVLDAIMEKDAVTVEGWLNADKPIVIDADTDEDVDVDVPLGPVVDNASINIESVDPSIVALLSPNNLPRRGDRALQPNLPSDDASLIQESNASSSNTPSPAMQPRKASPTFSSIPRLRTMIHEPTTPGGSPSAGSDTTFKGSTTTPTGAANGMQQPNRSDGSLVQRRRIVSPSPLSGYSTPDLKTNSIPAAARSRMIGRSWSGSHSHSSVSSAPVTPSSSTQNLPLHPRISSSSARLQVQIPSQTTNTRPLSQSRTPSPILHAPPLHSPQSSYTPAMTSASTSSVPNLVPTAPATPSTPNSIIRLAPGVSRQNSESSHSLKPKFDTVDDTTTSMTSYGGRASLDSRRTRLQASNSETHVLATSTPFRRSSDDATATSTATTTTTRRKSMSSDTTTSPTSTRFGGRRPSFRDGYLAITRSRHASDAKEDSFSPSSLAVASKDGRPASPSLSLSPNSRVRSALSAPFRTRKRSMSVQESHGVFPASVISKRPDALLAAAGGRFTAGLRSSSSLSGRLANVKNKDLREESEEGGGGNGNSASRPPLHDWLGPRSVKALRAAGLLDYDREERDRDGESQHQYQYHHHMASLHSSSRERSGSVTTSVLSGASSSGRTGGPLTRFVSPTTNRSSASEYSPQHGRAQSRMAFSDAGGGGPGSIAGTSSRRGSETFSYPHGVGVGGQGLMHSPTFTTSTSGSRDRESRDTARSAGSTAPTSVSSSPYAYLSREREGRNREGDSGSRDRLPDRDRERDRDEVRELKEKHATETGALLGALSDSQRTTRMLREENGDLRERLERFADVEVENEELRKEVRGLR
ncbi:hypothetical protein AMATHDRAFT_43987, partial [Amanita thiersii Skay4041]